MKPLISIVIPTFNSDKFIFKALQSIKNQKFKDLEVIVIDAGSTDQTKSITESFDRRFIFHELIGSKQGEARNYGITKSTGSFIMFLDSDDILSNPNVLEECLKFIKEDRDVDFYNFSVEFKKQSKIIRKVNSNFDGCITGNDLIQRMGFYGKDIHTIPWNKIYKKNFLTSNKIFFPPLKEQEDMVFIINCCMNAKKIRFSNTCLVTADVRDDSLSRNMSSMNVRCCLDVFDYIKLLLEKHNKYEKYIDDFNLYKQRTASYILLMALYRIQSTNDFYEGVNIIKRSDVFKNKIGLSSFNKLKMTTILGIIVSRNLILLKILRLFKRFKIIKGY